MDRAEQNSTTSLNAVSRVILAATALLGLAVVVTAAPTNVAALARQPVEQAAAQKTLSAAPGIMLSRAYGVDDEDCVAVSHGGATGEKLVCMQ